MEKAVTFLNKDGKKLFGIVHIPEKSAYGESKIGINLLNPGIKYRVAPNRLNVKIARRLCQEGYYVFRFDPGGIGDREGELPEGVLVADIWEKIQLGMLVSDTIMANDFFVKHYCIDKLVLIGNCGGAITALMSSQQDSRIESLCLIDVPVNLRTSNMSFADKITEGGEKAEKYFQGYIKNLFNLNSWYRFISLQTDYKALGKILLMKLRKIIGLSGNGVMLSHNIEGLCNEKKLNRLFFESLESYLNKHKKVFFIMAGNDPGTEIFRYYFQDGYLKEKKQNGKYNKLTEILLIENANHVYTLEEWQELLIDNVIRWIGN